MTYPVWQPTHAYALGTRITPVTPDGTNWLVEVPGTSGNTEPVWPTVQPWTIVDSGVTWGLASSFRQQTVTGILAVLTAFQSANPTTLSGIYAARPKSVTNADLPCAYIESRPETIIHPHDIRTRTLSVPVVLQDWIPDNFAALLRMDALIDGLVDAFTLNYHAAGGYSITVETDTSPLVQEEQGSPTYNEVITISSVITEGRG